ncbi:MAG TPA: MFS transporter [Thermoplasmata archaeon]|nr:MFS transporter [Thermoplasmata archaeon]
MRNGGTQSLSAGSGPGRVAAPARRTGILRRIRNAFYLPRNAWILTATSTVWSVGGSMSSPFQSLYFYNLGASVVFIGYLAALSSAIIAAVELIGGYVGDAWGRKRAIILFSFVGVANGFIYSFIPSAGWLYLPVVVGSVAGIYGPLFSAALTESMEPALRPRGIASYSVINTLPSLFAPYVGGLLAGRLGNVEGLRIAFFLSGAFGVLGITWRALTLKETHTPQAPVTFFRFWRSVIRESRAAYQAAGGDVHRLLHYAILSAFGVGLTASFSILYFVQSLGVPPDEYGALVGATSLVILLLLFPAASLAERVGLKKAVVLASLSVPLNQYFFTLAKDVDELVAWSVVSGTGTAFLGPPLTSLQAGIVPRMIRGRIMAIFSALPLLASIPAQILGGYLYAVTPVLPFLAAVPAFVLSFVVLLRIHEPQRLER